MFWLSRLQVRTRRWQQVFSYAVVVVEGAIHRQPCGKDLQLSTHCPLITKRNFTRGLMHDETGSCNNSSRSKNRDALLCSTVPENAAQCPEPILSNYETSTPRSVIHPFVLVCHAIFILWYTHHSFQHVETSRNSPISRLEPWCGS